MAPKFIAQREKYMTAVYNHFASPPTLPAFCDAVMAVDKDATALPVTLPAAKLTEFAQLNLPNIEIVFDEFYREFAKYQTDGRSVGCTLWSRGGRGCFDDGPGHSPAASSAAGAAADPGRTVISPRPPWLR